MTMYSKSFVSWITYCSSQEVFQCYFFKFKSVDWRVVHLHIQQIGHRVTKVLKKNSTWIHFLSVRVKIVKITQRYSCCKRNFLPVLVLVNFQNETLMNWCMWREDGCGEQSLVMLSSALNPQPAGRVLFCIWPLTSENVASLLTILSSPLWPRKDEVVEEHYRKY